jgi:hypothetical protein
VLKALGLAVAATSSLARRVWAQSTEGGAGLRFFRPEEARTAIALADRIIPPDERSPGARGAGALRWMDMMVELAPAEERAAWRTGLAALDRACADRFKKPFSDLDPAAQDGLLTELSQAEAAPKSELEKLFVRAKEVTIGAYYSTEIGLKQELRYKGNTSMARFVGCTHKGRVHQP